jgi:hypothetical protein
VHMDSCHYNTVSDASSQTVGMWLFLKTATGIVMKSWYTRQARELVDLIPPSIRDCTQDPAEV